MYDHDLTSDDELLGVAEVRLEADWEALGSVERLTLKGQPKGALHGGGTFDDCLVSFRWELLDFVPPPATLRIVEVSATGLPTRAGKAKKKGQRPDPHLRFTLLEVGALLEYARTPSSENKPATDWSDALTLQLPKGSPRPPLISVRLWDDDLHEADDPLATADFRLATAEEQGGDANKVSGRVSGELVGLRKVQNVAVSFTFGIVVEGGIGL